MLNLYDLLGDGIDATRVLAWARGEPVDGLPRLSPAEASVLAGSWDFWARPGQKWTPGREFITDIQCGRGWGKNFSAGNTGCDAAEDPERWGGEAIILGPDPRQVKRDSLSGPSGIFATAERRSKSGNGPGINYINYNDRVLRFEASRGGGGGGLTVHWGASSDPKSGRGLTLGLAICDEFGVWYHRTVDEQGTNLWQSIQPAMRGGPDPKIISTQTPSRVPEVRALQRDAERPECPKCRADFLAECKGGRYQGDPGSEPWRLPTSPQPRLHPLLDTRTTVVTRECPKCRGEVVATVRTIFGATTDNPMIAATARGRAKSILASGTAAARQEFAPRGEVDSGTRGTLIQDENIRKVPLDIAPGIADRWAAALAMLGAEEVIVFVDPAVTTGDNSDDSGVGVACMRHIEEEGSDFLRDQVVGLQDWSVRPDEVESGAPSSVWGPRAYWLALFWGARRIIVETNNGGAEVLSLIQGLIARPPTEAAIAARLATETGRSAQSLGAAARRMAHAARELKVESFHRRGDKRARWGWYGETAARGEQALACLDWTGGARAWSTVTAQLVNFEPSQAAGSAVRAEKKDRADWLIAAAQVLLGVRETAGGEVQDKRADSWLTTVGART
jgi:hypothetical protein